MAIIVPIRRRVDSMALAMDSQGRKRRYSYLDTPIQLRGQLRGLGFDLSSSLSTIAQFDPEPISATALQVGASVGSVITTIENIFGIGAGRREADIIVPVANQITAEIFAPTIAEIQKGTALSCATCAYLYQQALAAWRKWIDYLHNTNWADGRAATQAEADFVPYWESIIGNDTGLKGRLQLIWEQKGCGRWVEGVPGDSSVNYYANGGAGGVFVEPTLFAGMGTPLAVGLGVLAIYFFSKRRGRAS